MRPAAAPPSPPLPDRPGEPQALAAAWLDPRDDVATALRDLAAGTQVSLSAGPRTATIDLVDDVALGHKFALRGIAAGRRVRKYGECIGRTTRDVAAGAWVHVHNLATTATRGDDDADAWRLQAAPVGGVRVLPGAASDEGVCPVYDASTQRLYWLDAAAPVLHMLDLARGDARAIALPRPAQVIVPLDDGTLALGTHAEGLHVDPVAATCAGFDPMPRGALDRRWTAATCDARGRAWLTAVVPPRSDVPGTLSAWGTTTSSAPLAYPTGIAAARDGRTLLVVDAARARIERFAVDANRGTLGPAQPFADAGALPGDLWGAAFDADGGLWCALRDAGCVLRFAEDGTLAHVVRLPVAQPTGCAFAGPGLRELVVTTAGGEDDAAGRILALDVGVAGLAPIAASRALVVQAAS